MIIKETAIGGMIVRFIDGVIDVQLLKNNALVVTTSATVVTFEKDYDVVLLNDNGMKMHHFTNNR